MSCTRTSYCTRTKITVLTPSHTGPVSGTEGTCVTGATSSVDGRPFLGLSDPSKARLYFAFCIFYLRKPIMSSSSSSSSASISRKRKRKSLPTAPSTRKKPVVQVPTHLPHLGGAAETRFKGSAPAKRLLACSGYDITRKANRAKGKLLCIFPGIVAPPAAAAASGLVTEEQLRLGELYDLVSSSHPPSHNHTLSARVHPEHELKQTHPMSL